MLTLLRLAPIALLGITVVACRGYAPPPAPAPVSTQVPATDSIPAVQPALPLIRFTIQVGAFSTTERAARYARSLQAFGLDAYHFIDNDGLCKVRFERFGTKAAARHRAAALQNKGVINDYYIVQPGPSPDPRQRAVALRRSIIQTARRFIGSPYRWGGESPQRGFDCSGLTMTVYRLNGLQLPRNSRAQFDAGIAVSRADLQIGDLVFFATGRRGRVSHVGIYSGQQTFIHASGTGKRIRSASLNNRYFKARYMGARRYL